MDNQHPEEDEDLGDVDMDFEEDEVTHLVDRVASSPVPEERPFVLDDPADTVSPEDYGMTDASSPGESRVNASELEANDSSAEEDESDDEDEDLGENSKQIMAGLYRIEQAIVQLLNIAADALDILSYSTNAEHEDPSASMMDQFKPVAEAYFSLLDKIQFGLRNSIHSLTQSNLLYTTPNGEQIDVPYKNYRHRVEAKLSECTQAMSDIMKSATEQSPNR